MAKTKIAAPKKASSTKKKASSETTTKKKTSSGASSTKKKTTTKKKAAPKKKAATVAADKTETASALSTIAQKLSGSAETLADFKKNPAAAIAGLLTDTDASDDTVQSIQDAVEPHGEGADMTSLLGSLAGLLGNDADEASAEDEAQGSPLGTLAGLLGVGGNSSNDEDGNSGLETIGNVINIVATLAPVFGSLGNSSSSSSSKKKKKKKTDTASGILDLLGKFLG